MNNVIEIIEFEEKYAADFSRLNIAWLEKYFYVEPIDAAQLDDPVKYFIEEGHLIYFARVDNEIAGTFAFIRHTDGSLEFSKMAVDEKFQGKKIGNRLMEFSIEKAKLLASPRIILYSNTILAPAIHLYRKYGFVEIPMGQVDYQRSNIKMEKIIE